MQLCYIQNKFQNTDTNANVFNKKNHCIFDVPGFQILIYVIYTSI